MSKRPIVQICFTIKNSPDFEDLKKRLLDAKNRLDKDYAPGGYLAMSCHLNRDICNEKKLPTDVPDMFEEVFGKDGYKCQITEKHFDNAIKNMQYHRRELATKAERLVILSDTPLTNVELEIELFTNARIIIV